MKFLALDLGDKWVGTAISDPLGITCKPYKTIEIENLEKDLNIILEQEPITRIIVGYPKTFSGTESDQTKKVVQLKEELEQKFTHCQGEQILWVLWDERLSSKRASSLKQATNKEEKQKSHSVAAAFILQSYLDNQAFNRE
ncbi:MAG: Holliday junction resolvase RuvX [bacterium]